MGAKQARGEETSTRLLDAALAVFAAEGRAGLTVQAISRASEVSLGSLYHHFKSADGLSAALYARCMNELLDAIADALVAKRSARTGIEAVVRAYLGFVGDHPTKARFLFEVPHTSFSALDVATIAAEKAPRLGRILDWLRPHVESGALVDLPATLVEMLVIGPCAEVSRRWVAGAPGIDLDEAKRLLPERIWRGLRREGT